jgi:hypothetical protein
MVFGTKAQTRTGHETNHNEAIARSKDNPEHTEIQDDIGIVFLTADSAVHQFQVQYTGGIDEDGKAMPPGKEYRVRVYTKQDGKWLLKAIFWQAIEE